MKLLALLAAVTLLAACAATPSSTPVNTPKIDAQKVAAVESVAKRAGVHVIWVNPPRVEESR